VTLWIAEPRDTLVVRDGRREFSGMGPMRSVALPWPSTTAGFVRTRVGRDESGRFRSTVAEARAIEVTGAWLARLDGEGEVDQWLFPAPRDALWGAAKSGTQMRHRLAPEPVPGGITTSCRLPMLPRPRTELPAGKPTPGPAFWTGAELADWLADPTDAAAVGSFGHDALHDETRIHVSIEAQTRTAKEGALFGEVGLRFVTPERRRLAVGFRCDHAGLRGGAGTLGGERRVSYLRQTSRRLPALPQAFPGDLVRVVLLTPAIFADGYLPASGALSGTAVVAACVGRPEPISGWSFETIRDAEGKRVQKGPKPVRWMAPAGSVYWVKPADPVSWAARHHLQCVSDDTQDRKDGFGLAAAGVG